MNRPLLFFCATLLCVYLPGCSSEGSLSPASSNHRIPTLHQVTINEVNDYVSKVTKNVTTRGAVLSVEPITSGKDTILFLVHFDEGWDLLSADRRLSRVLMRCDSGAVSKHELFDENTAQGAFMRILENSLHSALYDETLTDDGMDDAWGRRRTIIFDPTFLTLVLDSTEILSTTTQACQNHLLLTKWGQGEPWNMYTPYTSSERTNHCPVGCVPVATGQVLHYLHYIWDRNDPVFGLAQTDAFVTSDTDSVVLTSSNVSFSNPSVDNWDPMPLSLTDTVGTDFSKASALLVHLGYLYRAKYKRNGTAALLRNAVNILPQHFGISCNKYEISSLDTLASIAESQIYSQSLPLMMSVSSDPNSQGVHASHAMVVDGYKKDLNQALYHYSVYSTGPDGVIGEGQLPDSHITRPGSETSRFVAVNWGFDGAYNNASPGTPVWYNLTASWVVAHYTYTQKNYIIYNFAEIE